MFASLFILIALVQGYDQPTLRPQQPRVTVIASHLIRTERPGDFSADGGLLRAERETAHRIESGLGLSEVATIGDGYATGICTQGATEYVLLMTAEVNPYPLYHDSSSAYPPVTDPPRRIFTHPRLRATLWRCPGILVQTAFIDSPRAPFEDIAVASSLASVTQPLANAIIDAEHARASHAHAKRLSVVAKNMGKKTGNSQVHADDSLFVAEQHVAQAVEIGLGIIQSTIVPSGSPTTLCSDNATDYVLIVEASLGAGYTLERTTPPIIQDEGPKILVPTNVAPQLSALLLKCPGTTLASSFITAAPITKGAATPTTEDRFASITQAVTDPIITAAYPIVHSDQIPANHS